MQDVIGIAGSGIMGAGIAQVAAMNGHEVFLFDTAPEALDKSRTLLLKTYDSLTAKGKIEKKTGDEIISRVHYSHTPDAFSECGLIIEAIAENLETKQKLFSSIEQIIPPGCILATNTSSLSVTAISAACKNPGRVIGTHFFNPPPLMPLVEIIPGMQTAAETTAYAESLLKKWNKVTVIAKDTPGFIVNRIARPYYGEALRIYEEGIADFATIDRAMKEYGNFKMGPFELMDLIGIDINYTVTETIWKQMFFEPRYRPSLIQKQMVDGKRLGRKTFSGFYNYREGAEKPQPQNPDNPDEYRGDEKTGKEIFLRIIAMLINEAADALYYGVASKENIDLAIIKGLNYPKGLLAWADDIGAEKILSILTELQKFYGEDRYRPAVLLKKSVKESKKFYN